MNYPYRAEPATNNNETKNSYIRILHATEALPNVDIYANGNALVKNLSYGEFSNYIPVLPGNYNVEVYAAGTTTNPLLSTNLYITPNSVFNVAAIKSAGNVSLYPIPEPLTSQNFGRACIRFVNLSETSPAVNLTFSNGTSLFNSVGFKDITDYACITPGTYSFNIKASDNNTNLLTIPSEELLANTYYSIYMLGNTNSLKTLLISEAI